MHAQVDGVGMAQRAFSALGRTLLFQSIDDEQRHGNWFRQIGIHPTLHKRLPLTRRPAECLLSVV